MHARSNYLIGEQLGMLRRSSTCPSLSAYAFVPPFPQGGSCTLLRLLLVPLRPKMAHANRAAPVG